MLSRHCSVQYTVRRLDPVMNYSCDVGWNPLHALRLTCCDIMPLSLSSSQLSGVALSLSFPRQAPSYITISYLALLPYHSLQRFFLPYRSSWLFLPSHSFTSLCLLSYSMDTFPFFLLFLPICPFSLSLLVSLFLL